MFFEDEKENIKGNANISIQEDGTVTWEDVLSSDDDLIIPDKPAKKQTKETKESAIDLGDELQLVQNADEDINDEELMQILNNSSSITNTESVDSYGSTTIESQLSDVILDNKEEEIITPRKNKPKNTSSNLPILIAIMFALLAGGGAYYGFQYYVENKELNQEAIAPPQTPQEQMNNMNQEILEQRQQETTQEQKEEQEIPVVNEEQVAEVKPEEKEEERKPEDSLGLKKEVVVVSPTGRSNPFLPISKYLTTTIPEANVDYDRAGIPKPPDTYGAQETETTKLMTIAVSGIMYDEIKPSAIITYDNNDYFVQKGDRLDDYRVLDITRTYVTLALQNNVYKASIGEEFKVSSRFYGNAQFIPETQGGGRQYYSIGRESKLIGRDNQLRYVSEDDITINAR